MSVPHEFAVDQRKIVGYLLNAAHPRGRSKAKFFLGRGYGQSRPERLVDGLLDLARRAWPGIRRPGRYGALVELTGELAAPDGTKPVVCTVWEFREEGRLWLVTAYPG